MLGDKRFLRSIRLRNILSFGPEAETLELNSLNVLIGPNGSGKSNLIEAISLLQACPSDLLNPIRATGGISDWLWKGADQGASAELDVHVAHPSNAGTLRHHLLLGMVANRTELLDEAVENELPNSKKDSDVYFYYRYQQGRPVINVRTAGRQPKKRQLQREDLRIDQSVLSQRRDPEQYPELTFLNTYYSSIRIYRDLVYCRNPRSRGPQPADSPQEFLEEDASNLAMVLNRFDVQGNLDGLCERLRDADGTINRISTAVSGNTVQLNLHYPTLQKPVPANRLSDGTVRYLALLSILLHPDPPPLVCIDEPELGLHPDLLPGLAELLIDASHRMQLVVTTHSDILVDALTEVPEAVVVCEKHNGSTVMKRLNKKDLSTWLEDYGLGQLWRKGELGGVRW